MLRWRWSVFNFPISLPLASLAQSSWETTLVSRVTAVPPASKWDGGTRWVKRDNRSVDNGSSQQFHREILISPQLILLPKKTQSKIIANDAILVWDRLIILLTKMFSENFMQAQNGSTFGIVKEACALKWNRVDFVENEKWVVERFPLGRITVWWHGHGNQWSADALFYSAARFLLCRGEPEPRSQATVPLDDLRPSSVCLTSPDCSPAQWCLVLQMFAQS